MVQLGELLFPLLSISILLNSKRTIKELGKKIHKNKGDLISSLDRGINITNELKIIDSKGRN